MARPLVKVVRTQEREVPNLGKRIEKARKADSRSLTQLCALVGMTAANWYRIESEKQMLPEETLRRIEEVLGVDFGVSFDD
jgi:transcriptional regulator with XRE-family HTH domain